MKNDQREQKKQCEDREILGNVYQVEPPFIHGLTDKAGGCEDEFPLGHVKSLIMPITIKSLFLL